MKKLRVSFQTVYGTVIFWKYMLVLLFLRIKYVMIDLRLPRLVFITYWSELRGKPHSHTGGVSIVLLARLWYIRVYGYWNLPILYVLIFWRKLNKIFTVFVLSPHGIYSFPQLEHRKRLLETANNCFIMYPQWSNSRILTLLI